MQNIKINCLKPNERNPRKELGDLSELTESIKANGIMQNLTVVPEGKKYVVVIGHRRLAAAQKAGLKEVPCEVKEMSVVEQVQVMLMENMQRSDLTITEEAKGIQMCLELGINETDLSKKTGLSKTTIKNRVILTEFDLDNVQKGVDRGAKLDDFIKLSKITDKKKVDELVKEIGSNSFNWKYEQALSRQKTLEWISKTIKILNDAGAIICKPKDSECMGTIYRELLRCPVKISDELIELCKTDTIDIYAIDYEYGIEIRYTDRSVHNDQEEVKRDELKRRDDEIGKNREALERLFEIAYQLRMNFIKEFKNNVLPDAIRTKAIEFICSLMLMNAEEYYFDDGIDEDEFNSLFGVQISFSNKDAVELKDEIMAITKGNDKALILIIYLILENKHSTCIGYGGYCENDDLYTIYMFLEVLGYIKSEEEKSLLDGSNELYQKIKYEDEDNDDWNDNNDDTEELEDDEG